MGRLPIIYQFNRRLVVLIHNNLIYNGKPNSELTRRIQIGYYWVKDLIDRGFITIVYCPTENIIADFFTKPLQGTLFNKMREKVIGVTCMQHCGRSRGWIVRSKVKGAIASIVLVSYSK